jgi:hypothetical protein
MGFLLPKRPRNETPNERLALPLGDIVVDEVSPFQYSDEGGVDPAVRLVPFDVFVPVLERGYTQNDEER